MDKSANSTKILDFLAYNKEAIDDISLRAPAFPAALSNVVNVLIDRYGDATPKVKIDADYFRGKKFKFSDDNDSFNFSILSILYSLGFDQVDFSRKNKNGIKVLVNPPFSVGILDGMSLKESLTFMRKVAYDQTTSLIEIPFIDILTIISNWTWTKENLKGSKIKLVDYEYYREQVKEKLLNLGFEIKGTALHNFPTANVIYIFTDGTIFSEFVTDNDAFKKMNLAEVYVPFLLKEAAKSPRTLVERFANKKFVITNLEDFIKIQEKLFELGIVWEDRGSRIKETRETDFFYIVELSTGLCIQNFKNFGDYEDSTHEEIDIYKELGITQSVIQNPPKSLLSKHNAPKIIQSPESTLITADYFRNKRFKFSSIESQIKMLSILYVLGFDVGDSSIKLRTGYKTLKLKKYVGVIIFTEESKPKDEALALVDSLETYNIVNSYEEIPESIIDDIIENWQWNLKNITHTKIRLTHDDTKISLLIKFLQSIGIVMTKKQISSVYDGTFLFIESPTKLKVYDSDAGYDTFMVSDYAEVDVDFLLANFISPPVNGIDPNQLLNTKFEIKDYHHKPLIQEMLFKLGFAWGDGSTSKKFGIKDFIYIDSNKNIEEFNNRTEFKNSNLSEINIVELLNLPTNKIHKVMVYPFQYTNLFEENISFKNSPAQSANIQQKYPEQIYATGSDGLWYKTKQLSNSDFYEWVSVDVNPYEKSIDYSNMPQPILIQKLQEAENTLSLLSPEDEEYTDLQEIITNMKLFITD